MYSFRYVPSLDMSTLGTLLNIARDYCKYFIIVSRSDNIESQSKLLEYLKPYLFAEGQKKKWPGTELLCNDYACSYKYMFNDLSCQILKKYLSDYFDAFEDISLLREDGKPWFLSITHEKDAYFILTKDEHRMLCCELGANNLLIDGEDECPDEHY